MNILFTGGSGLLGKHLVPLLRKEDGDGILYPRIYVDAPSHEELDITGQIHSLPYDLIIHAAAYTDVAKAEVDKQSCFDVNIMGTMNLVRAYQTTPFVFISSEYAYNPVNYYSVTKFLGELLVNELAEKCLIIRTLFKDNPFPYEKAFKDQITQGDYVDVIAPLICTAIMDWVGKESEMKYIGTGRKTMLELARRTRPDIKSCSINDVKEVELPYDYE